MTIKYQLPDNTKLLFKKGEKIDFNQPLYIIELEKESSINIAKELSIKSNNIFHYLKKLVGENIEKNEVIAEKKGFFSDQKIYSPYTGVIKEINHQTGILIIKHKTEKTEEVFSPFKGEIEKIEKNQLYLKLKNPNQYQLRKSNGDFGGEIFYLDNYQYTYSQINNKIIICEKIDSYNLSKINALGGKGIISLEKFEDEKININYGYLKNEKDYKKIIEKKLPYCTVISHSDTIYFYS